MFSGTGHQIYGGTYYNVNGNINMQTHHHQHLEIQNLPQSAPLQLEEGGSQVRLAIKDHEGDPTPPLYHRNQGTLPGVTRNPHHPSPARWAPYNATSRPLHQIHPTADEETSSSNHQNPHKGHVDSEPLQQSGPHPQQGGIHITAQNVHTQHGDAGMQILLRFVALEGLHNSADSVQQPRCHPETRVNMLDTIYTWMIGEGSAEPTGWLYGPAGAGKSAVMQSLAQRLQEAGRLGGAFFFKRGHPTCGNAKELFTTLAYQLAENDDRLRPVISQTVERSSTVVARDMQTQFHHLIMEPCQSLVESLPPILLIDGLDECQEECVQLEILHLIGRAAHLHQYPRGVRVLIASRPEAAICEVFTDPNFDGLLKRFNIEQSFKDVQTYLMAEFARIHREHRSTMGNIPTPWPSPEIIRSLVDKSSGYFVYPSTVIKFVDDKFFRPTERLHEIQNLHSSAPFKALDQLYIHILSTVPDQFRSGLSNILQCLALQLMMTVEAMDSLFEWQQGDCQLILRGVHSLLKIPPESEHGSTLAVQHASLLDFLNNEERSLAFHLNLNTRTSVIHAILKAFGTAGSVRSAHLHSPFLRAHQGHQLMRTIVSLPPTSELVLLVRNINPDLLWWNTHVKPDDDLAQIDEGWQIEKIVTWLRDIDPQPQDIIKQWREYYFMFLLELSHQDLVNLTCSKIPWELTSMPAVIQQSEEMQTSILAHALLSPSPQDLRRLQEMVSPLLPFPLSTYQEFLHRSPNFVRIFQARWRLGGNLYLPPVPAGLTKLYRILTHIHLLMNESWDNIKSAITALVPLLNKPQGKEEALQIIAATSTTLLSLSLDLFPESARSVLDDLTFGCLRVLEKPLSHEWDHIFGMLSIGSITWGKLVRDSPYPNIPLLRRLEELSLPRSYWQSNSGLNNLQADAVEFQHVVEWLKGHPDAPPTVITRWEGYLADSRIMCRQNVCEDHEDRVPRDFVWPVWDGHQETLFNFRST